MCATSPSAVSFLVPNTRFPLQLLVYSSPTLSLLRAVSDSPTSRSDVSETSVCDDCAEKGRPTSLRYCRRESLLISHVGSGKVGKGNSSASFDRVPLPFTVIVHFLSSLICDVILCDKVTSWAYDVDIRSKFCLTFLINIENS